ncbi:hypothetical protein [Stakelama tenebrarum]|uniref:Uncharacterized protein n=1 Tax=Stakelama tenebrarum TaxID=2711215 RepID=A0A6G6Y598_9SPHN|nr:hypothetical protein [Sphingosinithalassobacter tenebrarum]QIG80124.1 hypothetical protein G5C33_10250 [Sphingosinithalassobacter tenebrarum]
MTEARGIGNMTEGKVTRVEWGVIASLLVSALTLAFTFGILYGNVQRNEQRIETVESKVDEMTLRLGSIDANVDFLAQLAREERARRDAGR